MGSFNVPLKSRAETIRIIAEYLAPALELRAVDDVPFEDKTVSYGVRLKDLRTVEYGPNSCILGILHECGHTLLGRSLWDPAQHGHEIQKWMESLPNTGHPFRQFEELCNRHFGFALVCHLDIVLESIEYDRGDHASSAQRKQVAERPDLFPKMPALTLCLKPLRDYLRDPADDEAYMRVDVDFHPLYGMQKNRNGKEHAEGEYFDAPITLAEFKRRVLADPVVASFGVRFWQLLGVLDDELGVLGHISAEAVKKNMSQLEGMFRIPEPHRKAFADFWSVGLVR